MSASGSKTDFIGFLTVTEHEGQGLFGGYLVLNTGGRPIEFHCTAPVRANRAQEILYGPTLKPYLYGEQIGRALLDRGKSNPLIVFTDLEPVLALRPHSNTLVALVTDESQTQPPRERSFRLDGPHPGVAGPAVTRLHRFSVGSQHLAVEAAQRADEAEITKRWTPYAEDFDLLEPFGRIREAIDEARRSVR